MLHKPLVKVHLFSPFSFSTCPDSKALKHQKCTYKLFHNHLTASLNLRLLFVLYGKQELHLDCATCESFVVYQ